MSIEMDQEEKEISLVENLSFQIAEIKAELVNLKFEFKGLVTEIRTLLAEKTTSIIRTPLRSTLDNSVQPALSSPLINSPRPLNTLKLTLPSVQAQLHLADDDTIRNRFNTFAKQLTSAADKLLIYADIEKPTQSKLIIR